MYVPCYVVLIPALEKRIIVKGDIKGWIKDYLTERKTKDGEIRYYYRNYRCYIVPVDPEVMLRMVDITGDERYDPTRLL